MSKGRLWNWLENALAIKQRKAPQIFHMAFDLPESRLWNWLESTLLKKRQRAIIQPPQLPLTLPSCNMKYNKGGGMLDTVYVCTHALDRWRERAAARLDEGEKDVIEKLKASRKIAHDEYLPIPRLPNTHYYHHKDCDAYFVVEPIDKTSCRIVTVIVPEVAPRNYINPKKKVKKVKPTNGTLVVVAEEEVRIHITPAQADPDTLATLGEVMQRVLSDTEVKMDEDWKNRVLEYRRYVNMMHEVEKRLSSVTRAQPIRKQLIAQLTTIKNKLAELKPDYRRYLCQPSLADNDAPIRADGSVNYVAAILHLMKKTDEQQKEIEELKNAVAMLSVKG